MRICVKLPELGCSIPQLYKLIADIKGIKYEDIKSFDPSKVYVSKDIMNLMLDYMEKVEGIDEAEAGMTWVCYGPKMNVTLTETEIEIEDGFIELEEK